MTGFEGCSSELCSLAIEKLRFASQQLPNEKTGLFLLLQEVSSANATIAKCEKTYQEQAQLLNLTISQSISSLVEKEISSLEKEARTPFTCNPIDATSVQEASDRLREAKVRLVEIFDLTIQWSGSGLKKTQMERIAELFEKFNEHAKKAAEIFKQFSTYSLPEDKAKLLEQVALFQMIASLGSDKIDPEKIFGEHK